MKPAVLVRGCALALSLFHLAMIVSLFIPSLGPASEDRLVPESLLQVFFAQYAEVGTPAPAIPAGFLILPLLLPPLASWAACRSPVRMGRLLPLWSCLPLLLVGLFFWLLGPTDDPQRLPLRLGFALSFLLTLGETIALPLLLRSQEQTRLVNHSEHLPAAQDQPARRSDTGSGTRQEEHTGTRRAGPSFVLLLTLLLLCYLLIFLSLFFPYTETSGGLEPVSFQTTGWQLSGAWLGWMGGLMVLTVPLFFLTPYTLAYKSFTPMQKDLLLFRSLALTHLFNLLGFLSSSLMLLTSSTGDLYGPFTRVDAAFGIPPAAFLLASIGSGLLLNQLLEPQRGASPFQAPGVPL